MLPVEFARAREEDMPLSLLVLDIDQFKLYNDLHGHAQGDEAVKAVAQALRKHARKPYVSCRYGGDEFCAILPGTNEASAAVLAERLRSAVQSSMTGEHTVTVSIGYACQSHGRFESADQLFEAADAALYSAKQQGRNCIAEFRGPPRRRTAGRQPGNDRAAARGLRPLLLPCDGSCISYYYCHRFDHSCMRYPRWPNRS